MVSSVQEALGDGTIQFLSSRSFQTGKGNKNMQTIIQHTVRELRRRKGRGKLRKVYRGRLKWRKWAEMGREHRLHLGKLFMGYLSSARMELRTFHKFTS